MFITASHISHIQAEISQFALKHVTDVTDVTDLTDLTQLTEGSYRLYKCPPNVYATTNIVPCAIPTLQGELFRFRRPMWGVVSDAELISQLGGASVVHTKARILGVISYACVECVPYFTK